MSDVDQLLLVPHHASTRPFEYFHLLAQRNADAAVRWAQELTVCSNPSGDTSHIQTPTPWGNQ
jgi:hypothetical protein